MRIHFVWVLVCFFAMPTVPQTKVQRKTSSPLSNKSTKATEDAVNEKIADLEKRINKLEGTLSYYKFLIDNKQERSDTIQLDPSEHTFQRLDSDTSYFLVIIDDANPYLNGYRLKLRIGNLSSATFAHVALTIKWAKAYEYKNFTSDSYNLWEKSVHEKETTLSANLEPGSWNSVVIDLIPCAPDEMGYLEASIKSPSVILYRK